ncbi:hypothetical protein D3C76_322050 [compost metagenome]
MPPAALTGLVIVTMLPSSVIEDGIILFPLTLPTLLSGAAFPNKGIFPKVLPPRRSAIIIPPI